MKTFADFLIEAKTKSKSRKSDYDRVYAEKVAAARDRQSNYVKSHKERTQQRIQQQQQAENRKKEEEKENQEYISHIKDLKKEIKREVKREYGIKD